MLIINKSNVNDKKFRDIIKFANPRGNPLPEIIALKNSKATFYGYYVISEGIITVGIGNFKHFPQRIIRSKPEQKEGYASDFFLRSKEEALLYLFAHELRHHWQRLNPKAPRLGNVRRKYSESDADLFALQKLDKWRLKKKRMKMLRTT